MKPFEFMYGDTWYKYENGYIYRQDIYGVYVRLIPVMQELARDLDSYSLDQKQLIMGAVIHSYTYGKLDGARGKVKEIQRVLNLD